MLKVDQCKLLFNQITIFTNQQFTSVEYYKYFKNIYEYYNEKKC